MAQKVEVQGGKGGRKWDDGSEYDAVTKIQVAASQYGIQNIQFDYLKNGQTVAAPLHGTKGDAIAAAPFVINHPEEHIVSVQGWQNGMVQGLIFKTNLKTSDVLGFENGTPFTLEVQNKRIIGFHGFSGDVIDSFGAYFAPLTSTPSTPPKVSPALSTDEQKIAQKVETQGGKGGRKWDDGSKYDAVTKIRVATSQYGIQNVQFDYVKNGQTIVAPLHGTKGNAIAAAPFVINHPEEHLVSVKGWQNGMVQGLMFKTNLKTSNVLGFEKGTPFTLEVKDKKIIGFHGFSGDILDSFGAYFAPLASTPLTPAKKLPALGSDDGTLWDDGTYDGVKKVYVGQGQDGISVVKFVYDKGAKEIVGNEHGKSTLLGFEEFQLDYPSEYITEVVGTYDKIFGSSGAVITMLQFKTNKKTSAPFGLEAGTAFSLKEEGHKIVGFHGRASDLLHKFGVHVLPVSK